MGHEVRQDAEERGSGKPLCRDVWAASVEHALGPQEPYCEPFTMAREEGNAVRHQAPGSGHRGLGSPTPTVFGSHPDQSTSSSSFHPVGLRAGARRLI